MSGVMGVSGVTGLDLCDWGDPSCDWRAEVRVCDGKVWSRPSTCGGCAVSDTRGLKMAARRHGEK